MDMMLIKDANNKEIEINLKKHIFSITDDLDSEANKLFNFTNDTTNKKELPILQIVNASGENFNIADSENSLDDIVDIDIKIEASHSDTEINSAFYTSDSMLRDFGSYIYPFKKPFLKNHNSHNGEPLGRIIDADCIDSAIVDGKKALDVTAKISDKDAIEKILDGRYKTVSIGARPGTITCNTCGKHILKDGSFKFCGHFRGETYDNKKCTWKMEDLEYSELSIVNSPADSFAHIYKVVVNRKSDLNKTSNSTDDNSLSNSIINTIDNNEAAIVTSVTDGENTTTVVQTADNMTLVVNNTDGNTEGDNNDIVIANLEGKLEALNNSLVELQKNNDLLNEQNIILKIDSEVLSEKIDKISNAYRSSLLSLINANEQILSEDSLFSDILNKFNEIIKNKDFNVNNSNGDNSIDNTDNTDCTKNSTPKSTVTTATNPSLVNNANDGTQKSKNNNNDNKDLKKSDNNEQLNNILSVYS